TNGSCHAHVRAQSDIQVFYGFTLSANGDYPELYANSQSDSNYLIADAVGLLPFHFDVLPSLEGRLNYAILGYDYNMTMPLVMQDRWYALHGLRQGYRTRSSHARRRRPVQRRLARVATQ
ncbi:MD domain-containing protein, partial [Trichostrongylus colubriformis]